MSAADDRVVVYTGEALARYSFGRGHPFGPLRHANFVEEFHRRGLDRLAAHGEPAVAEQRQIEWFHTRPYVEWVRACSKEGRGMLDQGDTPAFPGVYDAAATVVGTTLAALDRIVSGAAARAFVPIAGLHHARRDSAAGFCVFNDCGVAIEALRLVYGIRRVAYVDIDVHHGDGVFYEFEADPELIFVDIHEDGRFLYPGTGSADETGTGPAAGTKLNIPMPPAADDEALFREWQRAERFLIDAEPEFILLQCGADSLGGDPLAHLNYSGAAHSHVATSLCAIADRFAGGRLLALGGGGYEADNIAEAWNGVVAALIDST